MATLITCCYPYQVKGQGFFAGCDEEAARLRTAGIIDSILFIALFTIGILAVIGSGTPIDHPLHGIGSIGALGGALMMAGGVFIGLPGCCCAILCVRS